MTASLAVVDEGALTTVRCFIFCAQVGSTLLMTGLIWFVQLVHYPLFLRADPARFQAFEAEHATRTGWIAGPLMVVELVTATTLLRASLRPAVVTAGESWVGFCLVLVLWGATGLVQIPLHNRLDRGFNPEVIRQLVRSNWIRTVAWCARTALVLLWLCRLLRA